MSTEQSLALRVYAYDGEDALLHAGDAALLSWFVSGAVVSIDAGEGSTPLRVRAVCDTRQALGGQGSILLPQRFFEQNLFAENTTVRVTSAKPHLPSVAAITRVALASASGTAGEDLDPPPGVPPDVLPNFPRRSDPSPERLIVLFDNSGSMAGAPLDEAKIALQSLFVEKLLRPEAATAPQSDEVSLIRFGDTAEVVFEATPQFMDRIPDVLALDADGGTPMEEALHMVPERFERPMPWIRANRRAILLTDGGATVSHACVDQLVDAGVTVIAIAIGEHPTPTLDAIASATGGAVVNAANLWQLDGIFAALA
jgi:Mg-chelatase subunit ChlD